LAHAQSASLSTKPLPANAQPEKAAPTMLSLPRNPLAPPLSVDAISEQIKEAKLLLKAHASSSDEIVTLAALDREDGRVHLLPLSKEQFLEKGALLATTTSLGHQAQVTIIRANGVNTAVRVLDQTTAGELLPLVVEYPITKNGSTELAYYTSAHPALLSPEVVADGSSYVRVMLDRAAARLGSQGVEISPGIVDIAEHLCIVEHTDHKRFLNEQRPALFKEILSLYALNQPDTYRYSVSTAGAGGMVQMIPSTYEMVRERHANVKLNPDFVSGMRDHSNALTAMLLYMQDTWADLLKNSEVRDALDAGIASQPELVAAGYNSNPARLPKYLNRGGSQWRTLIPSETQMYLQIYSSLDQSVPMKRREPAPVRVANNRIGQSVLFSALMHLLLPWN
jgi:hypothetical protein